MLKSVLTDEQEEVTLHQQQVDALAETLVKNPSPYRGDQGLTDRTSNSRNDKSGRSTNRVSESDKKASEKEKKSSSGQEEAPQSTETFQTWRQTLIQLRTMFPGGGNYSGVGVPLDPHEALGGSGDGNHMYARLLEMRSGQIDVMKTKMYQDSGSKIVDRSQSALFRPPNLYSGNLESELSDREPERDRERGSDGGRWDDGDAPTDRSD